MSDNNPAEERVKFETFFRKYNGWTFARDEDGDYTELAIELAFEAWTEQSRRITELRRSPPPTASVTPEEIAYPDRFHYLGEWWVPQSLAESKSSRIAELERENADLKNERACLNKAFREVGYVGDDLVRGVKNLRDLFDVVRASPPPNDRYELALRWLAESCDPKKLTGEFAVDHARRALEGSRIETAAPPISTQCATHAIEYRIIRGIPCPWCVIDELKRNRDKAVTPPSDVDGLNSPSYLREMANEMARRVDDVGKKAIMSYMALYNLRNAGIDVQVPESQLIDETRTRITVTGRIKDLRLFNQRMKEADLAIAYNEFKQPSPETRDCQCATYCMQALGMRSTPPQRCRGLPQLETRESRVSYPCANGCGNGVGTLGALCMSCERFIETGESQ